MDLEKWIIPNEDIKTIYYSGLSCSQTQGAKYCGLNGFIGTTGEKIQCGFSIPVISSIFIGKEIDQVILRKKSSYYFSPTTQLNFLKSRLNHWYYGINVIDNADNDLTLSMHSIDNSSVSIGGETDLKEHKIKYDLWKEINPNEKCILYGVSRGSATTFSAMEEYQYKDVSLVVLEGCFGKMDLLMQRRFSYYFGSLLYKLLPWWFSAYDSNQREPLDRIDKFPENIPVVFIGSEKDELVLSENTEELAKKLAEKKKNDVYLLILKNSKHSDYPVGKDKLIYLQFMHSIYKKYNLPYIENFAIVDVQKIY